MNYFSLCLFIFLLSLQKTPLSENFISTSYSSLLPQETKEVKSEDKLQFYVYISKLSPSFSFPDYNSVFSSLEGIRKAMNERNLNDGQWEDRKRWSLGVGQRRTTF